MGNKPSSKPESKRHEHRYRREWVPSQVSGSNGVTLYPQNSEDSLYHTVPETMTDYGKGSHGPIRPGLASYDPPKNTRQVGSDYGGQSSRSSEGRRQSPGLQMYIDRVTSVWHDLEALNDLSENSLAQATSVALAKVFERLIDNHTYVKTLSKDHDHLSKQNRNLMEEREVLANSVREREAIIQQLQSSLKAFRDSPRTGLATQTHSRQGSDGFRKVPNTNVGPKSASGSTDVLTLREKVIELEDLLKTYQSGSTRASPEREVEMIGEIQEQYADLEEMGLHQIKPTVDHISKQITEEDKFRLVFGVLLVAMERSNDLQDSLRTAIRKLVRHPDRFLVGAPPGGEGSGENKLEYKSSLIVRENVKMFENRDTSVDKDPRKSRVSDERIKAIFLSLRRLMSEEVNNCKLNNLEKEVTDVLKSEYGSFIHASLWFDSKFTKFLSDCCKLAWKITLTNRKIVLDFAPYEFYNEKRHLAYRSEIFPRSRVDYFAWPILIDMDSEYVLCKGRAHFS